MPKIHNHKRFVAFVPLITSIAITPSAVRVAYEFRGYRAVGGEWLIWIIGLAVTLFWLDIKKRRKQEKERKQNDD